MPCRIGLRYLVLIEQWRHPRRPTLSAFLPASLLRSRVRVPFATLSLGSSFGDLASPEFVQDDEDPPQEAVLKAISEVSNFDGRIAHVSNVIIGGTVSDDAAKEWLVLDQKVNSYPSIRGFTAIGTGGDDFVNAMVLAVESVIQEPIPKVQAVYNAMRRDERMKYFL